jgi:tetratricopeptide (TPR) repeat protein
MRIYRRLLKFLIVLLLCSLFVHSANAQEAIPTIVKKIEQPVVAIMKYDEEAKLIGMGSGFFVSQSGDVITNRHVLFNASSAKVKTVDGRVYPVRWIVAEDKEGDLIRLAVDIPQAAVIPVPVSSSIPEPGESVFVIGSAFVPGGTTLKGIVSSVRDYYRQGKTIRIVAPGGEPGYSGSPVVNTKGYLVGVIRRGWLSAQVRANIYASLAKRVEGLAPIKKLTLAEWNPEKAEKLYHLADGFAVAGMYNEELEALKQAISIDSGYAEAHYNLGIVYDELSRYEEAIASYKKAISLDSGDAEAHYNLGNVYLKLLRYDEAIASYKQAISLDSGDAEAHNNLGNVYLKLLRYDEAIASYKQAISIDSGFAGAYYNLGGVHHGLGRLYEAKEALEHAVRLDPADADARSLLGVVSFKIALYEKQIELCKKEISAHPDSAELHYTLGCLYSELCLYHEAGKAFEQAIRINPDYAEAHYKKGYIHLKLGDTTSAKREYEILKKLDKDLADKLFYEISKWGAK